MHGVRVLGVVDEVARHAQALSVGHAIVAMPDSTHGVRKSAVDAARSAGLSVLTVPSFDDLMSGKVTMSQVRDIELDDLLGRDPVTGY